MTRDPAPLTVLPRLPDGLEVLPRPADDGSFGRLRAQGLGGTDIAAILGQDPRRTAFDVWVRKTGLHEEAPVRDAGAAWGLRLESAIAAWWGAERSLRVTMPGVTIRLRAHPWALGNPDVWALRPEDPAAEILTNLALFGTAPAIFWGTSARIIPVPAEIRLLSDAALADRIAELRAVTAPERVAREYVPDLAGKELTLALAIAEQRCRGERAGEKKHQEFLRTATVLVTREVCGEYVTW